MEPQLVLKLNCGCSLESSAVSVSLSPTSRHLLVGLTSRTSRIISLSPVDRQLMAQVRSAVWCSSAVCGPGVPDQAAGRGAGAGQAGPQAGHQPGGLRSHEPQLHQVQQQNCTGTPRHGSPCHRVPRFQAGSIHCRPHRSLRKTASSMQIHSGFCLSESAARLVCCQRGSRGKNCAGGLAGHRYHREGIFHCFYKPHNFLPVHSYHIIFPSHQCTCKVWKEGCWISKTKTNNSKLVFSSSEMISLVPVRNSNCLKTLNIKLATLTGLQS